MHLCEIEALAVGQDGSGRALSPKGSFPARPRIRSLGQEPPVANGSFPASRVVTEVALNAADALGGGVTSLWMASQ
jgi:hypothetical protein